MALINKNNNIVNCSIDSRRDFIHISSKNGFSTYHLEPFKKIINNTFPDGVKHIIQINQTNIFILSQFIIDKANELLIWDDQTKTIVKKIKFVKSIQYIDATENYIAVAVTGKIFIYNTKDLNLCTTIDNASGPIIIKNHNFYYCGEQPGTICKYNILEKKQTHLIQAHTTAIQVFNVSDDEKYIITSSVQGTIIRIYSSDNAYTLFKEYRRGMDKAAISCLDISPNNEFFLVGNNTGTLHVFSLLSTDYKNKQFDILNSTSLNYLMPTYFSSEWSFTQFYLDKHQFQAFFHKKNDFIHLLSNNGCYYKIDFKSQPGTCDVKYSNQIIHSLNDPFDN